MKKYGYKVFENKKGSELAMVMAGLANDGFNIESVVHTGRSTGKDPLVAVGQKVSINTYTIIARKEVGEQAQAINS